MKTISKINKFVTDILFPIKCISCDKEGFWICFDCQNKILIKNEHFCGVCERVITPDGRTCNSCKNLFARQAGKNFLDALISACDYKDPTILRAVHFFKYRFIPDLHIPLGNLLISSFKKTDLPLPDVIIPVPLHSRRLRWRGFNQSELLAKHLSKNLLPNVELEFCSDLLIRHRYTSPQMEIKDYLHRQKNISDAFSVSDKHQIKNKTFLLIDDISTTGSTIFECAKTLKQAGAREVFAMVIARQENKKQ